MAMFRAMSVRRRSMSYERLGEEPNSMGQPEVKLERNKSVPAFVFGLSKSRRQKLGEVVVPENPPVKPPVSKKDAKSHPLFSMFDGRRKKKKPTANLEFVRYVAYLKEEGVWDPTAKKAVIYYK
ncbi:hypothetical protein Tsubulata_000297 [Turnera subulata]|uniref:Uncharacterized protein n=1 Tax=Turnera subulata TaxID=218843 RepID=A0A9Q0IZN9_9ROSI|nr:hypothetical protein Tsubulata_000297 [Turnera subulata]